jgi:hypothetical protein
MRKNIITSLASLFLLLSLAQGKVSAQSPIQCGLIGERCCNLAGGPPDSCQTGLICVNGYCQDDPNSTIVPLPRGVANPAAGISALKGDCIDTAIGCIPIEQQGMIEFILKWAIGIAGGIAFILIIIASFQIMTSQGDPKRLQAGKELLSSAIMGLILLIFSVFILRVIGVSILKIPGLS